MKFNQLIERLLNEAIEYGDRIIFTDESSGDVVTGTVMDPESLRWKKDVGQSEYSTYLDWVSYNVADDYEDQFDPENPFYYLIDGDDGCYHYVSAEEVKKGKTRKAAMDQGLDHSQADTITRV